MTNVKMENGANTETNFTKRHIAKLHEKMINKYEEMQKRLEKSKSIDELPNLRDDYNFQERKKFISTSDLRTVDEEYNNVNGSRRYPPLKSIVYQEKQKDASFENITFNTATIVNAESISNLSEKFENEVENTEENEFFNKNIFNTSLESLNEVLKESDESSEPFTPPPKSFRDRIESRLKKRRTEKVRKVKLKRLESWQTTNNKAEKYILSNSSKYIAKALKRTKIATVTIALVDVKGLEELEEKSRVFGFRFRLGAEKRKTKAIKSSSTEVKFQELFNLSLFDDDYILEGTLWDRDILIGRCVVNLLKLEKERTHQMRVNLDGEFKNIQCFFLLTISGTTLMNIVYDLDEYEKKETEYLIMEKKYAWYRLCDQFSNVGILSIIVYGAKGLSGQDCFCVLNLNNERIQTQTDYKTNDPSWMKFITFKVTDITSILEVIVYDEKKSEEIGRVSIPLLKIESGKKWFALKDSSLKEKAKGNNARILLEMYVTWNFIKAAVRVINKKEVNYLETDEKLDRHVFAKKLARAKVVTTWVLNSLKVARTCFEWESRKANAIALVIWIQFCLFAELWMMPLLLLIPFFLYRPHTTEVTSANSLYSKNDKDDKNLSIRQRINNFQEILLVIQNVIGKIANIGESVKNLFNFTVPFVSFLAIFFIILITLVLYLIPFNYIFLFWGIHKFTRKILRPNRIPNNEILDLLSRVPDDETLIKCEELPLGDLSEDDEK